jgi:hypothetical protein
MVTMRPPLTLGIIALAVVLAVASFRGGQVTKRRAQPQSSTARQWKAVASPRKPGNRLMPDENAMNDHVLIANVATVSFGELWDVMRSVASDKRTAWARELEQMAPGTRRNAAIKSFYKILGELDPNAAVESIEKIPDRRMRSMAFYAAADAAADSALPAFAELEKRLGYRTNSFSATAILSRWAAVDPVAVAHFLDAHPQTNAGFFMDVTYNWANSDPQKAAAWFTNLKLPPMNDPKYPRAEDRRRLEAARGLLDAWLEKNSQDAAAFAATHATDPDIKSALGEFAGALFTKSHDQAATFIASLPNEDTQRAALDEISKYIGGELLVMREGGDDEEPEEPDIPAKDVPRWLVTLPENLWVDNVGEIFEGWERTDSSKAETWLRSLPSDLKSKAIRDYCGGASAEQASRVFDLSKLIDGGSARAGALQKFIDNLSDDPSEAREKIASLSITNQQKQELLHLVRKKQ